ncbi:MAG: nucleotidyltransferase family protein [Bacteroidales bacterium]|nr:nucleotidyltransferase family protein [Bacteroidales bacterium]
MKKEIEIQFRSIDSTITLLQAMKVMDERGVKMLLVFNKNCFVSILTIGDIQRAIIHNISLSTRVSDVLEKNKIFAREGDSLDEIKQKIMMLRAECMPILDDCGNLVDVIFWDEIFQGNVTADNRKKIDIPIVIMAGGAGTRLKPLTNVLPKPLIPVGEKTIIEEIMDRFESIGCKKFYISVNYKVEMLKFYLSQLSHHYDIEYFQENKPLGTIGSVSLLKGKINTPFIVSNCDIVIEQDYSDVYDYHVKNGNEITLIAAVKSQSIPYGVVEAGESGLLSELKEKPENTFMINTGVYILNPELIDEIPEGEMFHITQLIEKVKLRGGRVGCFPISENAWRDMGEWNEYLKYIGK